MLFFHLCFPLNTNMVHISQFSRSNDTPSSVESLQSGAASSDPDTLQRPTVHLLPQISIGATCLCVSLVIGAVW